MNGSDILVIYLHENIGYLEKCAELLNTQWPRSLSARKQALEKSFKDLPDSIILVKESDGEKIIGHSRLTRVLEDSGGCWIGSVVILKDERNKGYGKYLMNVTENYAKKLNFSIAYLNTHDKNKFYEHLGYVYCEPVSSINFNSFNWMLADYIHSSNSKSCNKTNSLNANDLSKRCTGQDFNRTDYISPLPPPPPPPLPQAKLTNLSLQTNLGQYWMKKKL